MKECYYCQEGCFFTGDKCACPCHKEIEDSWKFNTTHTMQRENKFIGPSVGRCIQRENKWQDRFVKRVKTIIVDNAVYCPSNTEESFIRDLTDEVQSEIDTAVAEEREEPDTVEVYVEKAFTSDNVFLKIYVRKGDRLQQIEFLPEVEGGFTSDKRGTFKRYTYKKQ